MPGIGNGLSSGIQSLNNNVLVHIGRQCPSSWTDLKANISRNMKTCAKVCTAFLDSSFGLAVSMGIVGIVTTSLCIGEDIVEVVVTTLFRSPNTSVATLSALSNNELVYLCTQGYQDFLQQGKIAENNWTIGQFGIGQENKNSFSEYDIYCFSLQEYQDKYPNTSFPKCLETDWTKQTNYNASKRYFTYVYVEQTSWNSGFELKNLTDCMMKGVFDMLSTSNAIFSEKDSLASYKPPSVQNVTGNDRTKANDGVDRGAYCWRHSENMRSQFPQYFPDTNNCTMSKVPTLPPNTTLMPLTTDVPGINSSCLPCNIMMIAFGVCSSLVLTTTVGKIIYKQCKAQGFKKSKNASRKARSLAALTLEEGLLLSASGIGLGALIVSVIDPCGPVDESAKKIVMASTVLYWTSAASRLLSNCITSPIGKELTQMEDVIVELPMLAASEPALKASGADEEKEEKTIVPVVVVLDSLE
ncbi:hypothetical protein CLAVI_000943 [Candidatus Clavichlamydia salmonicola]|uniref:hypothetical protein n=1 Tax=Candidatus Clavichlamydia salmonicola TaxID=469812 RepID=UPI0018915487|nr:hypothetical protein [Candidatus Clavichlamydia salmonicola]MBF5051302.1 hypothetical protein [Candidatus Clavichlamydia salmonicola]